MKRIFIYIISVSLFSSIALTSCEDAFGDFLDKMPSNELTEDQVFGSWENTKLYFFDTYNFLRNGRSRINDSWMDSSTDLGTTSYSWGGTRTSFNIGNYYAAKGAPELMDTWEHYYEAIRKCNTLLDRIYDVPLAADETAETREAETKVIASETRLLRAYFYWELILRYGAIPIITDRMNPEDDIMTNVERPTSSKECFTFILSELDDCYADLETDSEYKSADKRDTELGRVTQGVNLALMSRIKLYLASPQYASLGLATWQDAVNAASLFMQQQNSNYSLFTNGNTNSNYQNAIIIRAISYNEEPIFWRNDNQSDWLINESPVGFGGKGGLCPSQNLVDMYDMADGSSPFLNYDDTGAPIYDANGQPTINTASGYSDDAPYENRDPRFYQTVLYHGSTWWNRAIDTSEGGSDNPNGNANATPTSYYNKKYMDDSQTDYITGGTMYRNWIFIRYAEILLNYAEALNEVNGPTSEVFAALQQLRDRVGMTALLSERSDLQTQDAMRKFIRKERTIELAFEDHRAWDVRRWGVAEEALARPIYGFTIENADNAITYTRKVAQTRVFESRMYLYPIPEEEIWKTGWENNPGW